MVEKGAFNTAFRKHLGYFGVLTAGVAQPVFFYFSTSTSFDIVQYIRRVYYGQFCRAGKGGILIRHAISIEEICITVPNQERLGSYRSMSLLYSLIICQRSIAGKFTHTQTTLAYVVSALR